MRFDNVAETSGLVSRTSDYDVSWFRYDNESGIGVPVADRRLHNESAVPVPIELNDAEYAGADVRTLNADYREWSHPVRFYFRRVEDGWATVGIARGDSSDARPGRSARR
jgi:hypothetical protein